LVKRTFKLLVVYEQLPEFWTPLNYVVDIIFDLQMVTPAEGRAKDWY
jgi:hypothetical protein